jgi:hypothetical protein
MYPDGNVFRSNKIALLLEGLDFFGLLNSDALHPWNCYPLSCGNIFFIQAIDMGFVLWKYSGRAVCNGRIHG